MKKLVPLFIAAALLNAGATRTWIQKDASDFEKGQRSGLSLRSDGRLTIAPKTSELFDASSAYLWALARDSKGNLYTGGGPDAKLFEVAANGSHRMLAEFDALEIHAIAIDTRDRLYAATSPDGKIYRVAMDGKSEVFYDPKQKYIWGMVFGPQGDLYVATGDAGEIYRVDPNGNGRLFFRTGETHVRSIAMDSKGNLLVGTAPDGQILRISPSGTETVLYQMTKREITALAVAPDGSVYAAGAATNVFVLPQPAPVPPLPVAPGLAPAGVLPPRSFTSGGVDVYKFGPSGSTEKVWSNPHDTVYAIAFDSGGRPLLAAGNPGTVYRIDSGTLSTALLGVSPSQILSLVTSADGSIYAATGNVGKVYRFGPAGEPSGTLVSDIFDSAGFSRWGRVKAEGTGNIELFARSGNVDRPQDSWSAWAPVKERSATPASRYLQWKAVLSGTAELESVSAAYLPRNTPPEIQEIEATPPNYRFPEATVPETVTGRAAAITLPALGQKPSQITALALNLTTTAMVFSKGWIGARWNARDENDDSLIFSVEICPDKGQQWQPLVEKIHEKHYSFDSTIFADGRYRLRVTASDSPGNVEEDALSAQAVGPLFVVDNTPPRILDLSAARNGSSLHVSWKAADALNVIERAEYLLDGGDWKWIDPTGKLSDSQSLDYDLTIPHISPTAEHVIAVRVSDSYGNEAISKTVAN